MTVSEIAFALIRAVICENSSDILYIKEELNEEVYKELYALSCKHDIAPIIARALTQTGFSSGGEISKKFGDQTVKAMYRDASTVYASKQAASALETAGIPYILLKGAVMKKYYPHSWMRTSCDVDVLIPEELTELASKAFTDIGFTRAEDKSAHDHNFIAPNKAHIELHYTLTQDGEVASADDILTSVWDKYSACASEGSCRRDMTDELFFVYHMAHMGRHLLCGGTGIRSFIDLWLMRKNMPCDEKKLFAMLEEAGLLPLYRSCVSLCEVWFEGKAHDGATKLLEEYVLCGGVYGTVENAASVKAATGVSKARSFLNVMFLTRENLCVIYPNLKKHPILLPFYQVKRWFGIFDKKRRARVTRIMDARASVTDDSAELTGKLLQSLGLK